MRVNFDDGATAAPSSVVATPLTQTIGHATTTGKVTATPTIVDPGVNNASLKYQWYQAPSASTTIGSTLLAGETSSTLTPATNSEGTFYYYVVVSNSKAPTGVTSNNVTVIVGATSAPSGVSVTPSTPQEVDQGHAPTPLSASVANTGGAAPSSITYQWYSRTTDSNVISGATQIPGANTSAFLPQFETPGVLYYFCVATNSVGSTASNTVKVEIKGQGVPIPSPGGTVTIDNIEWRVLATDTTTPGGPYHLITTARAVAGNSVYNPGSSYIAYADQTTGGVRAAVNNWYAARGDELKSRAYMPNTLASETVHSAVQPAAITAPGTKANAATADVAFLLSWSEASTYLPAAADRILRNTSNTAVNWWLRSPGNISTYAGYVATNGPLGGNVVTASNSLRPALWIK